MKVKNIDNRKIIYEAGWSFKYDSDTQLTTSLHCHAEYELIYIISRAWERIYWRFGKRIRPRRFNSYRS